MTAGLCVVLLLVGFGLWFSFGTGSTITLDLNGGAFIQGAHQGTVSRTTLSGGNRQHTITARRNAPMSVSDIVPTRPGWVFQGWMVRDNAFGDYVETTRGVTGNTLYAHWERDHYTARMIVNGITTHTIDVVGGLSLENLPASTWAILDTPYYTFQGWEFADLVGNRVTLTLPVGRANGAPIPANPIWTLRHYDESGNMVSTNVIDGDHLFNPDIYDMAFNAILNVNRDTDGFSVAFNFHGVPGQPTPSPHRTNYYETIQMPAPSGMPANFLGWALEVPTGIPPAQELVRLNPQGGVEWINRLGHDRDTYGAAADRARMDRFLSTIFAPEEIIDVVRL